MEMLILNQEFVTIALIETYESMIWTDRYYAFGDFEIYTHVNKDILRDAQLDYYLFFPKSEKMMIIDEHIITSDAEIGNYLTIRGRSLESILDRRIIWAQTILSGNFQNEVLRLLNENVINPTDPSRKISNFIFEPSTDPEITSLTIDAQFTGTTIYDAIRSLCEDRKIGFKIILNDLNQFVFSFYKGKDRSYAQDINPFVVFSPSFDNIINSNYLETNRVMKTAALVAGEGEGLDRKTTAIGGGSDLDRRELFVDARDISSDTQDGTLDEQQYEAQLVQRGNQRMTEYSFVKTFEGDVETSQMFVYGVDFFLGDTVQFINEFGIGASTRVDEIIFSSNNAGDNIVPTFTVVS